MEVLFKNIANISNYEFYRQEKYILRMVELFLKQ